MRRFLAALLVPAVLVLIGTVGYHVLEGWSWFDALYMTVTTLTTVGYGEVHPLTTTGRTFTMVLILLGVFSLFAAAGAVIQAIVSGAIGNLYGRQRMERALAEMHGHIIICGYGRMGRFVGKEFASLGIPFVAIERDKEAQVGFDTANSFIIEGDATSDEVLRKAGIDRARALVSVLASDADNLYITMSARLLVEPLFIVARAEDLNAETKLIRAGANRVISPYIIGGHRVAQAVVRPAVVDFIELALRSDYLDVQMEEMRIGPTSTLVGKTLQKSNIRQEMGIIILGIKGPTGTMQFNPPSDAALAAGDVLITIGHRDRLDQLEKIALG